MAQGPSHKRTGRCGAGVVFWGPSAETAVCPMISVMVCSPPDLQAERAPLFFGLAPCSAANRGTGLGGSADVRVFVPLAASLLGQRPGLHLGPQLLQVLTCSVAIAVFSCDNCSRSLSP